jgi:hypothetical protein
MRTATRVEISFFLPTGWKDIHFVETEDRGDAVRQVMAKYDDTHLACLNYVTACACAPRVNGGAVGA